MLLGDNVSRTLFGIINELTNDLLIKLAINGNAEKVIKEWRKECIEKLERSLQCSQESLRIIKEHYDKIIRAFKSMGLTTLEIDAILKDKGLFGVSQGIIYAMLEVGLNWDYLLDLPYIPSSSIKGSIRNTLIILCAIKAPSKLDCVRDVVKLLGWIESPSNEELKDMSKSLDISLNELSSIANEIHGISKIIFIDSYPISCNGPLVERWVITPHKVTSEGSEYDVSPIPLLHLVLRPGIKFKFLFALSDDALNILNDLALRLGVKGSPEVFFASVVCSTLEKGLGARTMKGYSRFKVINIKVRRTRGSMYHEP